MLAKQKRPDVVEARKTWHRRVARKKLGRPIVLDETAFTTNRHTACGDAPKGERLTVFEPHGHRNTTTFVGALSPEGLIAPPGDRWPHELPNLRKLHHQHTRQGGQTRQPPDHGQPFGTQDGSQSSRR